MKNMTIEQAYNDLVNQFKINDASGYMQFNLRNHRITVRQPNVIGNIIEEWLSDYWTNKCEYNISHNLGQTAPDFWFDPDNKEHELLEIKCFDYINRSPGFDIANFQSYVREIVDKPYRLHSKYLAIGYGMNVDNGLVTIHQVWLKNVWDLCCSSSSRPIKVQEKKNVIYNIRPCVWYGNRSIFPSFNSLEDFLSAIEQTLYEYPPTRTTLAEHWLRRLQTSYKKQYGQDLVVPRWFDIKDQYMQRDKAIDYRVVMDIKKEKNT